MGAAEGARGQALWGVRAVDAVVEFLEGTTVGCRTATRVLGPREGEVQDSGGGQGRRRGAGSPSGSIFSLFLSFVNLSFFPLSFHLSGGMGSRRLGCLRLTHSGLGQGVGHI